MSFDAIHHLASSALHLLYQISDPGTPVAPPAPPPMPPIHHIHKVNPNASGCFDSPEAPTNVLLMVGSIGMAYGSSLWLRLRGRGGR